MDTLLGTASWLEKKDGETMKKKKAFAIAG